MIRIIYVILAITIEDLTLWLDNLNVLLKKGVIWFMLLTYERETGKQMAGAQYYQY